MAAGFEMPIVCDSKGNIFLKTEADGASAIHELNPAGERIATFTAGMCPDIKLQIAAQFAVADDGRIYQVAIPSDDSKRAVIVFNADGSCHSKIKLDTPFSFIPYQIATYRSGTMVIAGLRWTGKTMSPYTALFSSSGTVLKSIELEDDAELENRAIEGDPKVVSATNPSGNSAVARGQMELASDGSVYLMRRVSPAVLYAISEGGAVVRRFTVDPGESDLMPSEMHIAGNRIAILFRNVRTNQTLLKVVNLEGKGVASYTEPTENGKPTLGLGFACYSFPPDKFTFLTTFDDNRIGFRIAEPH
jgi:hypothetical protein